MRKTLFTIFLVAAISISFVGVSEAMEAFLWVEGVKGESIDKDHTLWIDLTSFIWGHKAVPSAKGVIFDTLSIEKFYDSTSPTFAIAGATSQHFPRLLLEIRNPNTRQLIERVELQDVIVGSYSVEVPQGQALSALARPTEKVSFRFARISWEYFGPTGSGIAKKGYDLLLNKRL